MNPKLSSQTDLSRYRWKVFARCLLAIFAGFTLASLSVPVLAYSLPQPLAIGTYIGMMSSFLVWLCYVIYVFSVKSLWRVTWVTIVLLVLAALLLVFLQA